MPIVYESVDDMSLSYDFSHKSTGSKIRVLKGGKNLITILKTVIFSPHNYEMSLF